MKPHRLEMTVSKRWRYCFQLAVRLMFLGLSVPCDSTAADKLVFGWSAIAGSQAVPWITKEANLFEKHGLDTTLIYLDGGSRAIQVLLSGDVPIVQGGGNSPVAARLRGGDVTLIAGIVNVLAYSLIVHPDIKRPEDLRGKKLAISRYGSNSDYATRKILIKWDLSRTRMWPSSRFPEVNPRDSRQYRTDRLPGSSPSRP
jgi:ABC-type nitrate/sulfonate/bicarbonate transport system substrate-binding protein